MIEEQLNTLLFNTKQAAIQAHETATHKENKAENKYDTLGLEAAYLAEGQAKRVAQLDKDLLSFRKLQVKHFNKNMEVGLGALVSLKTDTNTIKYIFISPIAGGISFNYQNISIMLITESSPLGKALKNASLGDDIKLNHTNNASHYEIIGLW